MPGGPELREAFYDQDLRLEAYRLSGVVQKFPNHFHEFYVVGFIEGGRRHLWCRGREYDLIPGDVVLFNPRDNHCCAPVDGEGLDYRALNIQPEVLSQAAGELAGREYRPQFLQNVLPQSELAPAIGGLYAAITGRRPRLEREEAFLLLLEQLLADYAAPLPQDPPRPDGEILRLCRYMEDHYSENLTLDELAGMTRYGKSYLLRSFTRQVGVSPYRYLQTVRLDRAKRLLERGTPPADAAAMSGFSDQSHFTNYFKEFIGLTPGQYQKIFTTEEDPRHESN